MTDVDEDDVGNDVFDGDVNDVVSHSFSGSMVWVTVVVSEFVPVYINDVIFAEKEEQTPRRRTLEIHCV